MAVNVKFALSCDVTPCIIMHSYQHVGGNWSIHFQGTSTLNLKEKTFMRYHGYHRYRNGTGLNGSSQHSARRASCLYLNT